MHIQGAEWCAWSNISHSTQRGTNEEEKWKSNEIEKDIVILCESPDIYLPIKYYNGNISSWRESFTVMTVITERDVLFKCWAENDWQLQQKEVEFL